MTERRLCSLSLAAIAIVCTLGRGLATAQIPISINETRGGCQVGLRIPTGTDINKLVLKINNSVVRPTLIVVAADGGATVSLAEAVRERDKLKATVDNWKSSAEAVVLAPPAGSVPDCEKTIDRTKESSGIRRMGYEASAYVGGAIDTFAPSSVGNYPPGESEAQPVRTRAIAGVDFSLRLAGRKRQLWISGETLYGVRSADFCVGPNGTAAPDETCTKNITEKPDPQNFRKIITAATSMEAYVAPRFEFLTLHPDQDLEMQVYVTGRLGFIALSGGPKLFNADHYGFGLLAVGSRFDGTYVEIGQGRTDLFVTNPTDGKWNRLKIDGLLSYRIVEGLSGFVQLYIDASPKTSSADAVQTFIGVEFGLGSIFGKGGS